MKRIIPFTKMHGAGNDYVYVYTPDNPIENPEELSILWSDRHKGIGGDGLILIGKSDVADFSMRMFNNDGSEGMMCGNGTRCIAKYVYDKGLTNKTVVTLETLSGIKVLHLHLGNDGLVESVTVDMGEPILADTKQCATEDGSLRNGMVEAGGKTYQGTFVSMGNPHFVIFVPSIADIDLVGEGRALENSPMFPERCNIEFVEKLQDGSLRVRVWERGTGITQACGTGACAVGTAACLTGNSGRESRIIMDGGELLIEWREADNHIYMTGPAATVFEGEIGVEE